jgi:hypothetical protein
VRGLQPCRPRKIRARQTTVASSAAATKLMCRQTEPAARVTQSSIRRTQNVRAPSKSGVLRQPPEGSMMRSTGHKQRRVRTVDFTTTPWLSNDGIDVAQSNLNCPFID